MAFNFHKIHGTQRLHTSATRLLLQCVYREAWGETSWVVQANSQDLHAYKENAWLHLFQLILLKKSCIFFRAWPLYFMNNGTVKFIVFCQFNLFMNIKDLHNIMIIGAQSSIFSSFHFCYTEKFTNRFLSNVHASNFNQNLQ